MDKVKVNGNKTNSGANVGFEAKLWAAADTLRGSMDAAEYKHVVPTNKAALRVMTVSSIPRPAQTCRVLFAPGLPALVSISSLIQELER